MAGCSTYNPITDADLRKPIGNRAAPPGALKITFLGNSTLLLDDGTTKLLVDGYLSRPNPFRTFLGKMGPIDERIIPELSSAGVGERLDAVVVGHAHHDHALDATLIADHYKTRVIGNASFAQIYRGSHAPDRPSRLTVIPTDGRSVRVGGFTVRFKPSKHVRSFFWLQKIIEGEITDPVSLPARFRQFKCGDVFALHISHKQGKVAVTTTAAALPTTFSGLKADVVFLGLGFLSKETDIEQNNYWRDTVQATNAGVVVPVHWDNFSRKLPKKGGTSPRLRPGPPFIDDTREVMELVKDKAGKRPVRALDAGESIWIANRRVYCS